MESHHTPPTITCYPAPFRSIDQVSFEIIDDAPGSVYLLNADGTVPPREIETKVNVFWNPAFFFVLFRGQYIELRTARSQPIEAKTGKTLFLWEHSDVYEMFIGADARRTRIYKEFQIGPDSRRLDIYVDNRDGTVKGDFNWVSGFRCVSLVDEKRKTWNGMMEIPWKAFGTSLESNNVWDLNFYRASGRYHGDELLAWSPVGKGEKIFHQPEKFGRMVFQR